MAYELPSGSVFAGYRIEGVAGRGGMGVVYKATQIALDRPVALKVIAPDFADDVDFRERFKRESMTAARIAGGFVWVANTDSGTVTRIDASTGRVAGSPIRVGERPASIVAGAGSVWVSNSGDGTLSRIAP